MRIKFKILRFDKGDHCPKCGNAFYIPGHKCGSCGYE